VVDKVLFSSARSEWETPQDFFDELDREFSFDLDAAASAENAKCERFWTKEDNALLQPWDGIIWCNPPYTKDWKLTYAFVRKGYEEAQKGSIVVMLLAARTDVRWWHDYAMRASEIRLVKGRLRFSGSGPAPFPSAILVFRQGNNQRKLSAIGQDGKAL